MKLFDRLRTDLARDTQNVDYMFKLQLAVFGVTFFVFVLLGIIPLATIIRTKLALLSEMTDRMSILESNLVNLQIADTALKVNEVNIVYLEEYMPEQTRIPNYILDFIDVVSAEGYTVEGFASDPTTIALTNQHDLQVYLEGDAYPTTIVKTIETLKRVTQVKSFTLFIPTKGSPVLNMVLTIYNYIT